MKIEIAPAPEVSPMVGSAYGPVILNWLNIILSYSRFLYTSFDVKVEVFSYIAAQHPVH